MLDPRVEECVKSYRRCDGKVSAAFKPRLNRLPAELQEQVWFEIRQRGLDKVTYQPNAGAASSPKPSAVELTDDEWDRLADVVLPRMLKQPDCNLVELTNKAMAQFPQDRQRRFTVRSIEPLQQRLQKRLQGLFDMQAEISLLKEENGRLEGVLASRPEREAVLSQVSDEEIVSRYKPRLLDAVTPGELLGKFSLDVIIEHIPTPTLMGAAVQRWFESSELQTHALTGAIAMLRDQSVRNAEQMVGVLGKANGNGHANGKSNGHVNRVVMPPAPPSRKLPVVALVGLLRNQFDIMTGPVRNLANFVFVPLDQSRSCEVIPTRCDHIVIFIKRASHALSRAIRSRFAEEKIIEHRGGLSTLIELLQNLAPRSEAGVA